MRYLVFVTVIGLIGFNADASGFTSPKGQRKSSSRFTFIMKWLSSHNRGKAPKPAKISSTQLKERLGAARKQAIKTHARLDPSRAERFIALRAILERPKREASLLLLRQAVDDNLLLKDAIGKIREARNTEDQRLRDQLPRRKRFRNRRSIAQTYQILERGLQSIEQKIKRQGLEVSRGPNGHLWDILTAYRSSGYNWQQVEQMAADALRSVSRGYRPLADNN